MPIENLITFLRLSVNVQTPDGVTDPAFLTMSDDELKLYLELSLSQPFFVDRDILTLEDVDEETALILLAFTRKQLYFALAVRVAPRTHMSAGEGISMSTGQRFEHYMALVAATDNEIATLERMSFTKARTYIYGARNVFSTNGE